MTRGAFDLPSLYLLCRPPSFLGRARSWPRIGDACRSLFLRFIPVLTILVAALFDDYDLKAAVQLERLTRVKGAGRQHPDLLHRRSACKIAGATRADVDVISPCRGRCSTRNISGGCAACAGCGDMSPAQPRQDAPIHDARDASLSLQGSMTTCSTSRFPPRRRLPAGHGIDFSNHHEAHAVPPLFYSPWDEALLVTADGGGDTVNYSHRSFRDGAIKTSMAARNSVRRPAGRQSRPRLQCSDSGARISHEPA